MFIVISITRQHLLGQAVNECIDTRLALQYAAEATRCFTLGRDSDLSPHGEDALRMLQARYKSAFLS